MPPHEIQPEAASDKGTRATRRGWLIAALCAILCAVGVGVVVVLIAAKTGMSLPELLSAAKGQVKANLIEPLPEAWQSYLKKVVYIILTPWLMPWLVLIFVLERRLPAKRQQALFGPGFMHDFVGWFAIGGVVQAFVVAAVVIACGWVYTEYLQFLTIATVEQWPPITRFVAALMLGDFLNWCHHYLRHKFVALWAFHAVHHSQREMNMFTDARIHALEYVIAKPISLLPAFMLGLEENFVFWLLMAMQTYTRTYHANIKTNYGPLKYFMVTPQSHRIHHSADPRHADKNFGVIFTFWDHLFATQWTDYDEYPDTGIGDRGYPVETTRNPLVIVKNLVLQFCYPFRVVWRGMRGKGWELQPDHGEDR